MPSPKSPRPHHRKGGTRGSLFAEVARERLGDAGCLFEKKRFTGAVYLAGYAIECCLKQAICVQCGNTHLPSGDEVHSWDRLVESAKLWPAIKRQPAVETLYSALAETWRKFDWGPGMRYRTGLFTAKEAGQLYKEISTLYRAIIEMIQ